MIARNLDHDGGVAAMKGNSLVVHACASGTNTCKHGWLGHKRECLSLGLKDGQEKSETLECGRVVWDSTLAP